MKLINKEKIDINEIDPLKDPTMDLAIIEEGKLILSSPSSDSKACPAGTGRCGYSTDCIGGGGKCGYSTDCAGS